MLVRGSELGANKFRPRRRHMTTLTNVAGNFIQRTLTKFHALKDKVCQGGQLCNDLFTLGSLAFMVWFMYVAMEPILVFR